LYRAEINRKQPALLLLLIDQSYSMSEPWGEDGKPKAQALADTVNRLLTSAVVQCSKGDNTIHDYFDVGIIGYGVNVDLALHGADPNRPVLPIGEVGRNPRRVDQVMRKIPDGAGGIIEAPLSMPVWLDPVSNGATPMVHAMEIAEKTVSAWCGLNRDSFPPIVINLTDGVSTDGDPSSAAARVRSAQTNDGATLLFNVHLSAGAAGELVFPASAQGLPDSYAATLFEMSSQLPTQLAEAAAMAGYRMTPGARGFLYNAKAVAVTEFLDIGTRAVTPTGLKELTAGSS
jgi:hypothetical protein